jgi:enoyl-CoA hydratase
MSTPVARTAKETVQRAFETTLAEGVRLSDAMFATDDQEHGKAASIDKRPPRFQGC